MKNNNRYITLGKKGVFNKKLINFDLKNNLINKPRSAFWASPLWKDRAYLSDWHRFCIEENFYVGAYDFGFTFSLKEEAKIYVIDDVQDLEFLVNIYPLDKSLRFESKFFKFIDFEAVAVTYDGILLTEKGEMETRLSSTCNLYGWDVESLVLFNADVIDESSIEYIENLK